MKNFARFALVATLLLSASFTFGQTAPAHIYVYRPHNKLFGNALRPTLSCGTHVIAKVPNGKYLTFDITPGKYTFRIADGRFLDEHPVEFISGKTYYLRMMLAGSPTSVMVGTGAHIQLDDIPEDEARSAMSKLKPVPADKVTAPVIGTSEAQP
jgi:hypothetical protein